MRKISLRKKAVGAVALSLALAGSLPALAMAAPVDSSWIKAPDAAKTITADDTLLTTYGVRAGSAGGDYLGISNTNFDITAGGASDKVQYQPYLDKAMDTPNKARLAIFGSDVNENPNPYLYNLFYNINGYNGTNAFAGASTTAATTWMNNPHSWGDTAAAASKNVFTGATTIQGAEFGTPDIVYGATDTTCWGNYDPSYTNWYTNAQGAGASGTYVHNDSSNVWSQIYTMGRLASTADGMSGTTRYDKAVDSAVAYEKAIKGNMLYVASKLDSGTKKKTVAYLYAIDENSKTAYFFTPKAEGLTKADNTGKSSVKTSKTASVKAEDLPTTDYAANNATVSLGLMDVIPFISDTFDSGTGFSGNVYGPTADGSAFTADTGVKVDGIAMAVENYTTVSPACTVDFSTTNGQLKDVDVIIFNTSTKLTENNTSGGKNLSNVFNTGSYASGLTASAVDTWAKTLGFTGKVVAGDDYGTSSNQPVPGTADAVEGGAAPMLYCQRNYTADRDSRAAWAISQVYPELYNNNSDATYAYWVNKVYHVKTDSVPAVVQFMTNDSTATTYDASTAEAIEENVKAGYDWWNKTGSKSTNWKGYAYYNGSTRASFISGNAADEEPTDTVGIFAPSSLWTASIDPTAAVSAAEQKAIDAEAKAAAAEQKAEEAQAAADKAEAELETAKTDKAAAEATAKEAQAAADKAEKEAAAAKADLATAKAELEAAKAELDAAKATAKQANPITVKTKTITAKAKKKTTFAATKAFTVSNAQGKVTYTKASGNAKITVASNGKVTVKKGLKKNKSFKVKVNVYAAGNSSYEPVQKTVTLTVKVK